MKRLILLVVILLFPALFPLTTQAYSEHRLSISGGIERHGSPSTTAGVLGLEYEYRFLPVLGAGGIAEYLFTNPGVTRLGLPVFFHPLAGDWILLAAPIAEFQGGASQAGARLGTRFPIPVGAISLIPSVAIDLIGGNQNLILGLGLQL